MAKTYQGSKGKGEMHALALTISQSVSGHVSAHWGEIAWERDSQDMDYVTYEWL